MKFLVVLLEDGVAVSGAIKCFSTVAEAHEHIDSNPSRNFELYRRYVQPFKRLTGAHPAYLEPPAACCKEGLTLMYAEDPNYALSAYTSAIAHATYGRMITFPENKLLRMARWKLYRIALDATTAVHVL